MIGACQSQPMRCSEPCSINVRTALRGAMYLSLYLYSYRIRNFSWQIDLVLDGRAERLAIHTSSIEEL